MVGDCDPANRAYSYCFLGSGNNRLARKDVLTNMEDLKRHEVNYLKSCAEQSPYSYQELLDLFISLNKSKDNTLKVIGVSIEKKQNFELSKAELGFYY